MSETQNRACHLITASPLYFAIICWLHAKEGCIGGFCIQKSRGPLALALSHQGDPTDSAHEWESIVPSSSFPIQSVRSPLSVRLCRQSIPQRPMLRLQFPEQLPDQRLSRRRFRRLTPTVPSGLLVVFFVHGRPHIPFSPVTAPCIYVPPPLRAAVLARSLSR